MKTIKEFELVTANDIIEEVLEKFKSSIGKYFESYRNHVYRVVNFCILNMRQHCNIDSDTIEKIAIASVYHDLGIWTSNTWDYLQPSIKMAKDYLSLRNKILWIDEISLMIDMHHKIKPYKGPNRLMVESFRRADLMDIPGRSTFGISPNHIQSINEHFSDKSFKKYIYKRIVIEFIKKPWNPLPMIKL